MFRQILSALVIILSLTCLIAAQTSRSESKDQGKSKRRNASKEEEALKSERRAFALQLVSSLADEARSFKDDSNRVKVQARAADLLWDVDQDRARRLFARAWDAAQSVDIEGRRQRDAERKKFLSGRGGTGFIPSAPNLRAEVLRLASVHDRILAEELLAKMAEEDKRADEENGVKSWDPTEPPDAIAKRLQVARQLLDDNEVERAVLIAEPGLLRVTSPGIIFLVSLRQKNAARADQLFRLMLGATAADSGSDATAVALLSSYVFSPSVLLTATRNGLLMNPWTDFLPEPNLPPELKAQFFSTASQVLLRPLAPQELEATSAGLGGTYFTIKRLLPFFEQSDPETAVALQSRLSTLGEGHGDLIPDQQKPFTNAGFSKEDKSAVDFEDQINHATTTNQRNHLYALAARAAAMKNDLKARELANKIEDAELRTRVREFVDFVLLSKALDQKDVEKALRLTRDGELTSFQRSWSYSEAAALLGTADRDRAVALINDATAEAEHVAPTSKESPQAWIAIAKRVGEIDQTRKWQSAADAVKEINKSTSYTGEENEVPIQFQSRNQILIIRVPAPSTALATLFNRLAAEDIYRTADLGRSISSEGPRAVAILATARSGLDQKPATKVAAKPVPGKSSDH